MTAVMIATNYGAPVVYTAGDDVTPETKAFLEKHKTDAIKRVILVGVTDKAGAEINAIFS
jgi:D-aminopeptidase